MHQDSSTKASKMSMYLLYITILFSPSFLGCSTSSPEPIRSEKSESLRRKSFQSPKSFRTGQRFFNALPKDISGNYAIYQGDILITKNHADRMVKSSNGKVEKNRHGEYQVKRQSLTSVNPFHQRWTQYADHFFPLLTDLGAIFISNVDHLAVFYQTATIRWCMSKARWGDTDTYNRYLASSKEAFNEWSEASKPIPFPFFVYKTEIQPSVTFVFDKNATDDQACDYKRPNIDLAIQSRATNREDNAPADAMLPSFEKDDDRVFRLHSKINIYPTAYDYNANDRRHLMLHEVGHSLGFAHEQDHPDFASNCDFISSHEFGKPWTELDNKSVMGYPHCGFPGYDQHHLSDLDKKGMRKAYPLSHRALDVSNIVNGADNASISSYGFLSNSTAALFPFREIRSNDNRCLDSTHAFSEKGALGRLECDQVNQTWTLKKNKDGSFNIRAASLGNSCIVLESHNEEAPIIFGKCSENDATQRWFLWQNKSNSKVTIRSLYSDRCLNTAGSSTGVAQGNCSSSASEWSIITRPSQNP